MKKVMFLMSTNGFSGAEKVNLSIINNLYGQFHFAYVSTEGEIKEYLEKEKVEHIIIPKLSISNIKNAINMFKPDIIHATDYKASVMAALCNVKVPIISHLHNNSPWLKNINLKSIVYLVATYRFNKILTVSESIKKEYIFSKWIDKKVQNISNPVSTKEILELSKNKSEKKMYDICFNGRICEQKNPKKFIDIIAEIKNKKKDIKVVIIGKGGMFKEIQQYIIEKNLNENIEMMGFVKNPYQYMKQSKIFCLTSDWEGFGLVAFEALTLGLPCVVSKVGGLIDIVDEKCGKLCIKEEEYIEEIMNLLNDENYYLKKSCNALAKSKKIENIEVYMERMKDIYNKIIQ